MKNTDEIENTQQTNMQKDMIIQKLKEMGCRVTRQRLMLLDIILENECSCCKEIYYKAVKKDEKIGVATVYRMVNTLEKIGAISRKNMYKVVCEDVCGSRDMCTVQLEDGTIMELSQKKWNQIVSAGLRECGYMQGKE